MTSKPTTWAGALKKFATETVPTYASHFWAGFARVIYDYRQGLAAAAVLLLAVAAVVGYVWMMVSIADKALPHKAETPPAEVKVEVKTETEQVNEDEILHIDQALDAVKRAVSADIICYDEVQNGYLMHWSKSTSGNTRKGWYIMVDVQMYRMSNNTWFIKDVNSIPDVSVNPDVEGLECIEGAGR